MFFFSFTEPLYSDFWITFIILPQKKYPLFYEMWLSTFVVNLNYYFPLIQLFYTFYITPIKLKKETKSVNLFIKILEPKRPRTNISPQTLYV